MAKEMTDVNTWDMADYPDVDPRTGKPASDWFKLAFLTANGDVAFKTYKFKNKDGVEVEAKGDRIEAAITGGGGVEKVVRGVKRIVDHIPKVSFPAPQDIRTAEKEIGCKPTVVRMGLWHTPVLDDDGKVLNWEPVDRKKINSPIYWRDVTEEYYRDWRTQAYGAGIAVDPYKSQQRPYTRMQELELTSKALLDGKN